MPVTIRHTSQPLIAEAGGFVAAGTPAGRIVLFHDSVPANIQAAVLEELLTPAEKQELRSSAA